jgi:Cof subfamily protein (haloacid dehalogenase superfamily)
MSEQQRKQLPIDFHRYRLIVSDLDGTLVSMMADEITPELVKAVHNLSRAGVHFTIATGRSWQQARKIVNKLGIAAPVILQTGAIIFDPVAERIIKTQPLDNLLEEALWRLPLPEGIDRLRLGADGVYEAVRIQTGGGRWVQDYSGEPCRISPTETLKEGSLKYLYIGTEKEVKTIAEMIQTRIDPQPWLIYWPPPQPEWDWFLEVFDSGASKASAMEWIAAEYGFTLAETVAIGDGDNDIDLLTAAGLAVVVETAPPQVKRMAGRIIAAPEWNGAELFLKEWLEAIEKRRQEIEG